MKKTVSHPTLSDVARKARVGTTTVSRVINGGHRVDPATLRRVRRVIERLGYHPNQAARILKGERTKTIGLIVPSIADSFFSSCAETIQQIARSHDSALIVAASNNDPRIELEHVNLLIRQRTDGLLLCPANHRSTELAALFRLLSIPVICFDRPLYNTATPSVLSNNYKGSRAAVQHLVDHGYKRILCLGGEAGLYTIAQRIRGYRNAVEAAGLPSLIDLSVIDNRSAELALKQHFAASRPPDAIFTLKNLATISTFEVLQKLAMNIPRDVALLGFDDFELAATLRPAISVVQQPIEEIGRTAAELLFNQLITGHKTKPEKLKLETRLVLRSSCGC